MQQSPRHAQPRPFQANGAKCEEIISAERRATAGDSARKGVRAGYHEWGEGLGAWLAPLSGPHLAEDLPPGGPSAFFQSWAQDRIRENRWKYHRTGRAIQGFRYKLDRR